MVSLVWTILIALIDAISINLFYSSSRNEEAATRAQKRHLLEKKAEERLEELKNIHTEIDLQGNNDENTPDR